MGRIKYKEVAGLEVKRGRPTKATNPSESQLKKLYTKESRSIREIAEIIGCSKDMIHRTLKEYKIERRSHVKRLKLEKYDIDFIKDTVKKKGYRRGAQELGVNKSTLYRYLRKRGK